MVLGWRRPGRVGRCRIFLTTKSISSHYINLTQDSSVGKLILLSSVGSSERLLTARSLVRVQQGEPQKREHQLRCSFFVPSPLLSCEPVFFRKLGTQVCLQPGERESQRLSCVCANYRYYEI